MHRRLGNTAAFAVLLFGTAPLAGCGGGGSSSASQAVTAAREANLVYYAMPG